jgi:predicted metal-dependent hydrolase
MRADLPPGVVLRRSARALRCALRLDAAAGCVALVLPARTPMEAGARFAWSRAAWVARVLSALPPPVPFADGATLPVAGRAVRISVEPGAGGSGVAIDGGVLRVRLAAGAADPAPAVARFLRAEARRALGALLAEKAAALGAPTPALSVRDTRSRWGSCAPGPGARVTLSWRLVLAPPAAADYVVAHEAAHLVHAGHTRAFWALCRDLSADYAAGRAWMRDHGPGLLRYGAAVTPPPARGGR